MFTKKTQVQLLTITTTPHVKDPLTVDTIMLNVVYATLPLCAFSIYLFGLSSLLLILTTTLTCVLTEQLFCSLSHKSTTIPDYSAVITGILLALTLPPAFPLWMASVGGFVGISIGKVAFGGLGNNIFNPALVGRIFVQTSFPVSIGTWTPALSLNRFTEFIPTTLTTPLMKPIEIGEWIKYVTIDGFTGATPLTMHTYSHITTNTYDLMFGYSAGSAGETCAILIILCGLYLIIRKMMNWRIPVSVLTGAFVTSLLFYMADSTVYPDPVFTLFSGGLMLGAFFMASDYVGSPSTQKGIVIYGLFIGFITVVIRLLGGLPEGVMYAILLGNALSPAIDSLVESRVYGH